MLDQSNESVNRRKFLRATGTASGLALLSSPATAERTDEPAVGTASLTTVDVRFAGVEPTAHSDIAVSDVLESERGQVFLNRGDGFEEFRDLSAVVRHGYEYIATGEVGGGTTTELPLVGSEVGYQPLLLTGAAVDRPAVTVEATGSESRVAYNGDDRRLAVRETTTFEGPSSTVTTWTSDETVSVTPEVVVRNHGRVTAYGRRDAQTFPRHSSKVWVRDQLQSLKRAASHDDRTVAEYETMTTIENAVKRGGDR